MTTNMRATLERAYEAGRTAGILEMASRQEIIAALCNSGSDAVLPAAMPATTSMKIKNIQGMQKAPKVARGAQKGTKERVAGVKQGIMALIATESLSANQIITTTGFKATSVRATLMSLKKAGLAMNDDGLWIAAAGHDGGGNSEIERAPVSF